LKLLILGGTGFIGPHQVEYAVRRGHDVTLFNRGKTNPGLFPQIEQLKGDRNGDLESLKGRSWDAVIDNSASLPRWVRASAGLLKDSAKYYLFISSLSVFVDNSIVGIDEDSPVGKISDPTVEEITEETYGPLKALCEEETRKAFGDRAIVVRPGLIVGPGDRSDRFTYWPVRIDRGGEVLAPGNPADPVQIVDARDLAEWTVHLLESGTAGTFNAVGPSSPLTMGGMLHGIRAVTSVDISFTWVPADFLAEKSVQPWSDMPVWVPFTDDMKGFSQFNCRKAINAGLRFRPLAETARDTIDWFKSQPDDRQGKMKAGLSADREKEVLQAWHARAGA